MKKISLLLLCLITAFSAFAKQITEADALTIAQKFMQGKQFEQGRRMAQGKSPSQAQFKNLYVFNVEKNGGFVIVSGDDRTQKILGYAEQGSLNEENLPSNVKWLLDSYNQAIATLDDSNTASNLQAKTKNRATKADIPVLIDTQWGQSEPYNRFCPEDNGHKCVTGCTATAMAQVINYHRWPQEQTSVVPAYTFANNITMPELPQKQFDWNNMSSTAIAQLMQYCGQSIHTDYGVGASSAYSKDVPNALINVFGYSENASYVVRSNYSVEQWDEMVYGELSQGRPIFYAGLSALTGGHAFVVDGYSEGMYHVNWGWEGEYDGYFALSNLRPLHTEGFNVEQEMIINVCPPAEAVDIVRPKATVTNMTCSEKHLEKIDADSDFPTFTVGGIIASALTENATLQIGFALYDDNGFVKLLSSESHDFTPTDSYTYEAQVTFGAGLPNGNYRIVAVSRANDSDEWLTNSGSTTNHIVASSAETIMSLYVMPQDKDGSNVIEYGIHTIDGITYHLYGEYENLKATVFPLENNVENNYSGDIYIPDYVIYQNMPFLVDHCYYAFQMSPELTSLSIKCDWGEISSCPKLSKIEIREGITESYGVLQYCPSLESITYPQSCYFLTTPSYCEKMKSITLSNKRKIMIRNSLDSGELWNKESMPALTDVYFASDVPPTYILMSGNENHYITPNENVTIHIPRGSLDVYKRSIWKDWNFVEDQPANPVHVGWDNFGVDVDKNCAVYGTSGDGNNIEFAIRIPREMIESYKGNKITKIEFHTQKLTNGDLLYGNVEYVFLTTSNKDYITKKNVSTVRGTWMTVEFDEPYTITGEELFVGVGKKGSLEMEFANSDVVEDGFWTRVMNDDYLEPGIWKNVNDETIKHPLPIRAIIEGDNLPSDIVIVNAEFVKAKQQISLKLRNRSPKLVKQVTLDWDIDGNAQGHQTVETAMLNNHDDMVYIDIPQNLSGHDHTITINVASIDGTPDAVVANSTVSVQFSSSSSAHFPRKIVMEELTGAYCGWSPNGIATIEKLNERYQDNFIPIAIHVDDEIALTNDGYKPIFDMGSGTPTAYINRSYWSMMGPSYNFNFDGIKDNAEAKITATAYSSDGVKVEVTTETVFGFNNEGNEYRIAYVLTEDKVGPYNQSNAYSNKTIFAETDMDWWVRQGNWVPMLYNDVARGIYDYNGVKGLLPNEIKEGQKYNSKYEFTLPDNIQDKANLNVVTLLIDGATGEIMNADRTPVVDPSGIHSVDTDNKLFDVYNTMGMKVRSKVSSLRGLPAGIYIVNGEKVIHKP